MKDSYRNYIYFPCPYRFDNVMLIFYHMKFAYIFYFTMSSFIFIYFESYKNTMEVKYNCLTFAFLLDQLFSYCRA